MIDHRLRIHTETDPREMEHGQRNGTCDIHDLIISDTFRFDMNECELRELLVCI
jgi:hypothetical protein